MSEQRLRDVLRQSVPEAPELDPAAIEGRAARERRNRMSVAAGGAAVLAIVAGTLAMATLAGDDGTQVPPSDQTPTLIPWASSQPGPDPVPQGSVTPPLAGQPIDLQLIVHEQARRGKPLRFIVRIANLGSEPVSLKPCPYYRVQYLPHVETGYLNCAQSPDAIPPESHLDFAMQIDVLRLERDVGGTYDLLWQLGGEGAEGKTVTTPVELARSGVRVTVPSHCGVLSVTVDGQLWLADPPLGDHNPPPGWDENETSGRWVVIGPGRAEFRGEQGQRASFRQAPVGAKDPNAGCE
jgi:hypothetical protein